jgi:hypothetical protein
MSFHLPDTVTSKYMTQLQQALPQLQELVSLQLIGMLAHDDVLRHITSLSRLQDLQLVDGMFTPASFQQLPQSLTRLIIEWTDDDPSVKTLTASTAPGLAALTGLQHLVVRTAGMPLGVSGATGAIALALKHACEEPS